MTENANPKPLNISCQKCQSRENSFIGFINQSIKRHVYHQTGWTEFKSKTIKNVKGSFIDWVNPLFASVICMTKMTDQVWK